MAENLLETARQNGHVLTRRWSCDLCGRFGTRAFSSPCKPLDTGPDYEAGRQMVKDAFVSAKAKLEARLNLEACDD